jgi:hypothetical protein
VTTVNDAAATQAMQMQLGGSAAPRLRSSHVRESWTAMSTCAPAFGTGHVAFLGLTQTIDADAIATTKANPAYHRQPEEIST